MDKETARIIAPLVEMVYELKEQNASLAYLLALNLPNLSEDERQKLREPLKRVETYAQNLERLKQALEPYL